MGNYKPKIVLEVEEYFLFDPEHQYLDPPLQGYRLVDGVYVSIPLIADRLASRVLGLELGLKADDELGLYHPQTQRWLLTTDEQAKARQQAESRAEQAELRRRRSPPIINDEICPNGMRRRLYRS